MNKNKTLKLLLLVFLSLLFSTTVSSDSLRSIKGDWNNAVLGVELHDGSSIMDNKDEVENRRKRNSEIITGKAEKQYSLFDLYGGNIKFVPYYGETLIKTNLADKVYTAYIGKDGDFKLTLDDIKTLFKSNVMSNNIAYKNRPPILDSQEVEDGSKVDPRVSQGLKSAAGLGGITNLSNTNLTFSQNTISIIAWLTGSGLYNSVNDYWVKAVDGGLKKYIQAILAFLMPLLVIIFIYRIAKIALGAYKGRNGATFKSLIVNITSFTIILGTLSVFSNNPVILTNTFTKYVNIIDNQFDKVLNMTTSSPVVKSSVTDNVREAALWEKAVFNPWSMGTFGKTWDKTYTMADTDKNHEKMHQTNESLAGNWKGIRYNSYETVNDGKIYVQLSNKYKLYNFAAYAMSLQSKYHISYSGVDQKGYVKGTKEQNRINKEGDKFIEPSWPVALTTPKNDQIYLDYFRLIDSQLDISPEYRSKKQQIVNNYTKSKEWKQDFYGQSMMSLFYTALLFPLIVLGIRKIKFSLQLIAAGFIILYKSIMWFFKPEENNIIANYKNIVSPLLDYMWNAFIIYINVTIYLALVGKGLAANLLIILLGLYLLSFNRPKSLKDIKYKFNQTKDWIVGKSKNGVENLTSLVNARKERNSQ